MNQLRRAFLQRTGLAGAALFVISAGLLKPSTALAAAWNKLASRLQKDADTAYLMTSLETFTRRPRGR